MELFKKTIEITREFYMFQEVFFICFLLEIPKKTASTQLYEFKNHHSEEQDENKRIYKKFLKSMEKIIQEQQDLEDFDVSDAMIQYHFGTFEVDFPLIRLASLPRTPLPSNSSHSPPQMKSKVNAFIQESKSNTNKSNQMEFTQLNEQEDCARTNAADINRNIQMKLNVVHNESGPLDRSTTGLVKVSEGIEERIKNMEDHLNLQLAGNFYIR